MKNITCIICPIGCSMTAQRLESGEIKVEGFTCKRGQAYAISELESPKRTLTTTVALWDGRLLPVRSSQPLPKEKIFDCMEYLNTLVVSEPKKIGDKIVERILDLPIDILACDDV